MWQKAFHKPAPTEVSAMILVPPFAGTSPPPALFPMNGRWLHNLRKVLFPRKTHLSTLRVQWFMACLQVFLLKEKFLPNICERQITEKKENAEGRDWGNKEEKMDEESSFCILFFSIKDAGNIPPNGWNACTFGCPDLLSTHSGGGGVETCAEGAVRWD